MSIKDKAARLRLARKEAQFETATDAAKSLGVKKSTYISHDNGTRDFDAEAAALYARRFRVNVEWLIYGRGPQHTAGANRQVKVVGYVGAGSESHYYIGADDPGIEVPMPPGGTEKTVALEIRGTSLGTMFDRWIVYYDEIRTPPTPDMYRKLCVVGLADDRVLVKRIIPSGKKGLFHLESQTEGIIEDQVIAWCARVRAMSPS